MNDIEKARRILVGPHSLTCTAHWNTSLCSCGGFDRPLPTVDALIATVRAATIAEVRGLVEGYAAAYPVEVWPETPFSDAQAASVMRLMVPRILDALAGA